VVRVEVEGVIAVLVEQTDAAWCSWLLARRGRRREQRNLAWLWLTIVSS
jgi:hypothetical protein